MAQGATEAFYWEGRVKAEFEQWDAQGEGLIEAEELKAMLLQLRPDFTGLELQAILEAVDPEGNGTVNYKAFVEWAFGDAGAPASCGSSRAGSRRATGTAAARRAGSRGRPEAVASASTQLALALASAAAGGGGGGSCAPTARSRGAEPDLRGGAPDPGSASQTRRPSLAGEAAGHSQNALSSTAPVPGLRRPPALPRMGTGLSQMTRVDSELGPGGRSAPQSVRAGELRRAMDRLHQRVATGEAVMSDRLLEKLTTETTGPAPPKPYGRAGEAGLAGGGGASDADFSAQDASESKALARGSLEMEEDLESALLQEVAFGQDNAGDPEVSTGSCAICFEEGLEVVSLCGQASCRDRFCLGCSRRAAETLVGTALYAMPWLRCPTCAARVATRAWRPWVDDEVYNRYLSNGEALLNFRCPTCHDTGSLYLKNRAALDKALDAIPEGERWSLDRLSEGTQSRLRAQWTLYGRAEQSAEAFVGCLVGLLAEENDEADAEDPEGSEAGARPEGAPAPALEAAMRPAALPSLVLDPERRCTLQLAYLRRFPMIRTRCCNTPMCFKCKVSGWHEGESCEARQRREMHKDVQFCPGCGVPTVKSEGCDHIVCVCGESWTWAPSPVWSAVRAARVDVLEEMLDQGFDVNFADEETGETLLHVAAEEGNIEVLQLLLRRNADANRADAAGGTLLGAAVRQPYLRNAPEVLAALLEHSADANASISPDGGFVLTEVLRTLAYGRGGQEGAAEQADTDGATRGLEMVGMLIRARARVDVRDEDLDGSTPLLEAVRAGFDQVAALLIEASAPGSWARKLAALEGDVAPAGGEEQSSLEGLVPPVDPFEFLPEDSATPPQGQGGEEEGEEAAAAGGAEAATAGRRPAGSDNGSALHLARAWLSPVEASDRSGNTPLFLAATNRSMEIAKRLLAAGASPDGLGPGGTPPLLAAIGNQDPDMVELLVQGRADVNLVGGDGDNALHAAVRAMCNDSEDDGKSLARRGASLQMALSLVASMRDLDMPASDGQTAVAVAAANGFKGLLEALLQARAAPDRPARGGLLPLGWAAQCGQTPAVRLLLEHKADPCQLDIGGQTPLHRVAADWKWQDTTPSRSGDEWLARGGRRRLGRAEVVEVLLEAHAAADARDASGRTALLLATDPQAQQQHSQAAAASALGAGSAAGPSEEQLAVVRALLAGRCDVDAASPSGATPLAAVAKSGVDAVAVILLEYGANPNFLDPETGTRLLKVALTRVSPALVKSLLGHSASPEDVDGRGQPAVAAWLESFASAGQAKRGQASSARCPAFREMLRELTSALEKQGRTLEESAGPSCRPLLLAAWAHLADDVRGAAVPMLLEAKADVNGARADGWTLMHILCADHGGPRPASSSRETLRMLLEARGDALQVAADGGRPLDLAAAAGAAGREDLLLLLGSLPSGTVVYMRWGRQLLLRSVQDGDEALVAALAPHTRPLGGTGGAPGELGQRALEVAISAALYWHAPPGPTEQAEVDRHLLQWDLPPVDPMAHIRCAELLQKLGATLGRSMRIWSPCWDVQRAAEVLQCVGRLKESGPQPLLDVLRASPDLAPPALGALLGAACALAGVGAGAAGLPLAGPPDPSPPAPWWAPCWPAAARLLGADGQLAAPALQRVAFDGAGGELSPRAAAAVQRFLDDPALSGEALETAGGPFALSFGQWVRLTADLRRSHPPVDASYDDVCRRVGSLFAKKPALCTRWFRVLFGAAADADAEDGAGGRLAHLALRVEGLAVEDALLPLLRRRADPAARRADGVSVLGALQAHAAALLATLHPGQSWDQEAAGVAEGRGQRGLAAVALELAEAVAEAEQGGLLRRRLKEARQQQAEAVRLAEDKVWRLCAQVDAERRSAEEHLESVLPLMEKVRCDLESLQMVDIAEARAMARPTHELLIALAGACVALGMITEAAAKNASWSFESCMEFWTDMRKMLADSNFLRRLTGFDRDAITPATVRQLKKLAERPEFEAAFQRSDQLGQALPRAVLLWTKSLLQYYDVSLVVKPRRECYFKLQTELEAQHRHLAEEQAQMRDVERAEGEAASGTAPRVDAAAAAARCASALRAAERELAGAG